jgi:hypothetical protein
MDIQRLFRAQGNRIRRYLLKKSSLERGEIDKKPLAREDILSTIEQAVADDSLAVSEFFERFSEKHAGADSWEYLFEELAQDYASLIKLTREKYNNPEADKFDIDEFEIDEFDDPDSTKTKNTNNERLLVDNSIEKNIKQFELELPKLKSEIENFCHGIPNDNDIMSRTDFSLEIDKIADHDLQVARTLYALHSVKEMAESLESITGIENIDRVIRVEDFLEGLEDLISEADSLFSDIDLLAKDGDYNKSEYIGSFENLFEFTDNIFVAFKDGSEIADDFELEDSHLCTQYEGAAKSLSEKAHNYLNNLIETLLEG